MCGGWGCVPESGKVRNHANIGDLGHGHESVLREPALQAVDERHHVFRAMTQQRRRGGHDVGAGEQELHDLNMAVDTRSCGEGQPEVPRQQRDPGKRQVDIGGSRQRHFAFDAESLQIKVWAKEAIEQNYPVSAARFELSDEIRSGAQERRELD